MVREYQEAAWMSGGSWGGPMRQTCTCGDDGAPGSVRSFVFILIFRMLSSLSSIFLRFYEMKVEGKRGGGGWAQMTSAAINLEYECGGRLRCRGKLKCVLDCFHFQFLNLFSFIKCDRR